MAHDNGWNMDIRHHRVWHESGLSLKILGELNEPEEVVPLVIPDQLNARTLVALIREGVELCRDYRDTDAPVPMEPRGYDDDSAGFHRSMN